MSAFFWVLVARPYPARPILARRKTARPRAWASASRLYPSTVIQSSTLAPAPDPARAFSSAAAAAVLAKQATGRAPPDRGNGDGTDPDDLSDLDFSYEPFVERLGGGGGGGGGASALSLAGRTSASSSPARPTLTHVDPTDTSRARMVDVSTKPPTVRSGTAVGRVYLPRVALELIRESERVEGGGGVGRGRGGGVGSGGGKGPVLRTAQLAGIMGAKRTAELIPLCHPLPLSHVDVVLDLVDLDEVDAKADADAEAGYARAAADGAVASSETFLQHALDGRRGSIDIDNDGPSVAGAHDFGFRIEDLIDGDQWRGREVDLGLGVSGPASATAPASGSNLAYTSASSTTPSAVPGKEQHTSYSASAPLASDAAREGTAAGYVQVTCTARTNGRTGVEMEALVGTNVACLTVWDMVKAVAGREMWIGDVKVVKKTGGKSGDWERRD